MKNLDYSENQICHQILLCALKDAASKNIAMTSWAAERISRILSNVQKALLKQFRKKHKTQDALLKQFRKYDLISQQLSKGSCCWKDQNYVMAEKMSSVLPRYLILDYYAHICYYDHIYYTHIYYIILLYSYILYSYWTIMRYVCHMPSLYNV